MARALPKLPHPSVALVGANGLVTREWRGFFAEVERRIPITGSATFAADTTVSVTLAAPEADATYQVLLERPTVARSYSVGSKTTTGFVITASASNSDTINWTLVRT